MIYDFSDHNPFAFLSIFDSLEHHLFIATTEICQKLVQREMSCHVQGRIDARSSPSQNQTEKNNTWNSLSSVDSNVCIRDFSATI